MTVDGWSRFQPSEPISRESTNPRADALCSVAQARHNNQMPAPVSPFVSSNPADGVSFPLCCRDVYPDAKQEMFWSDRGKTAAKQAQDTKELVGDLILLIWSQTGSVWPRTRWETDVHFGWTECDSFHLCLFSCCAVSDVGISGLQRAATTWTDSICQFN